MFGTKERTIIPVNDDPRVQAARGKTLTAREEVDRQEADEQRLRAILEPAFESATFTPIEITGEMIHAANARLVPRRIGVSDVRYFDTAEGNQARAMLKAAMVEESAIRDAVRQELEKQVRDRAKDLCDELETALAPVRELALELLDLHERSGVAVPVLPGLLPGGSLEHEIPLLRHWAAG